MADEINTPDHRYYQLKNHIKLARSDMSKSLILASGIRKIDNFMILPLFALAEPGTWYDPSDLTTLFQDSAGTTPVTAPNQTVGLMLDKSQGLVLGPELVTNGDFATDTGWTKGSGWTIGGGVASCDGSVQFSQLSQPNVTPLAKSFKVSFTLVSKGASVTNLRVVLGGAFVGQIDVTSAGTYSGYFFNSGGSLTFALQTQAGTGAAFAVSIDNISVKLLAGNHATQATSGQRPTYGVNPITGTRNLLTFTEQFDNAIWNKGTGGSISANSVVAPDGTTTADAYTFATSTASFAYLAQATTGVSQNANTFSVWLKRPLGSGNRTIRLSVTDVDVSTAQSSTFTVTEAWQRFQFTRTSASTTGKLGVGFFPGSGGTPIAAGEVLEVWGAQLEQSATATDYQKVVTQYEVTEAGVQSASYIAFDGVDDGMVTGTITPATDKVQVFAGVRKLSDAAIGTIVELSADISSNNGAFVSFASFDGAGPAAAYLLQSKGTVRVSAGATGYAAPITNVLTGIGDIAGDNATLRVNGIQAETSASDQGTGNYLAYPLYIGRRGGSSLPYNGRIYSLIVRFGANLTAGQITSTESWVNGKTGAITWILTQGAWYDDGQWYDTSAWNDGV